MFRSAPWLYPDRQTLTPLMKGRFRMDPRTGIRLMNPTTTGKNPLDGTTSDTRLVDLLFIIILVFLVRLLDKLFLMTVLYQLFSASSGI